MQEVTGDKYVFLICYVQLVGMKRSDWPNENSLLLFLCRSIRKLSMYRAESFRNPLIVWGNICLFSCVVCTRNENMNSYMELLMRIQN
jgi:hypothetical protein